MHVRSVPRQTQYRIMTENSSVVTAGIVRNTNNPTTVPMSTIGNIADLRHIDGENLPHLISDNSTMNGDSSQLPLLWIPYVILTCIIIGLMGASFMRFHKKNGHKYQRRRMELLRQVNMQKLLTQIQDQVTHPGHLLPGHMPANGGSVGAVVPSRGADHQKSSTATAATSARRSSTKSSKSSKSNKSTNHHHATTNHTGSSVGGNRAAKRHTRPLMFTHNSNGSMVDLRCMTRECDVKSPFQGPATSPPQAEAPPFGSSLYSSTTSFATPVAQMPLTSGRSAPLPLTRGSRGSYSVPHSAEVYGPSNSYTGGVPPYTGRSYSETTYSGTSYGVPRGRESIQYATPYPVHASESCEDQRLLMYQNQSKV